MARKYVKKAKSKAKSRAKKSKEVYEPNRVGYLNSHSISLPSTGYVLNTTGTLTTASSGGYTTINIPSASTTYYDYNTLIYPHWTTTTDNNYAISGSGILTWSTIPAKMIFENEFVEITEKGEVLIDGKLELNPTKIGKMILKALEKYREKESLNDPKEFFNKD